MIEGKIQVYRYNPTIDNNPYYQEYRLNFDPKYRVVDVLMEIIKKYKIDISFEISCQSGVCGLCAIMLNHKPVLMCKETVSKNMLIEPLRNFGVVKDLIINRKLYQNQLNKYDLFLVEKSRNSNQPLGSKEAYAEKIKLASRCTRCFCCVANCPIFSKYPDSFAGPTAFVLEAYYIFHPHDNHLDRRQIIDKMGIELCIECGKCSDICPFNVNPMKLIKEIKNIYKLDEGG